MSLDCCPDCGNVMERDYIRKVHLCHECGEAWAHEFLRQARIPFDVDG
jgi:uncharacterized protein (DUF983 family)